MQRLTAGDVRLPVRRVSGLPGEQLGIQSWPGCLPAAEQLVREGVDLAPVTVLVGENGSGKSTLLEAVALAYGMSPEGGSTGARHSTRPTESELYRALALRRGVGASRWGFFMRAETMHGYYTYLEQNPRPGHSEVAFHEMSHGESFLEVLATRFTGPGLYLLDEPESALSFTGCLSLVQLLTQIATSGDAQAIVATHSPILAAVPGALILEVGRWGLRRRAWSDLDLVQNWSSFLTDPDLYLRHLQ